MKLKNTILNLTATNIAVLAMCFFAFCFITQGAFADGPDAITGVLCTVITALTGTIGKAVATIAIVVLGMGLFLGKLNWPLAIATAIGIGLIFGAPQVASWLGGSAATASCS